MIYVFGDYELDLRRCELRYTGKPAKLEPQVFNVLAYLIQHRDRVVSKQDLIDSLWPGRFVTDATLTSQVMAVRRAVGDRGREQRVIQTLHGRGYRFIAAVEERFGSPAIPADSGLPLGPPASIGTRHPQEAPVSWHKEVVTPRAPMSSGTVSAVGRETELEQLHHWLQRALQGTRQVVFITGEAGLGKTTLVETFLRELDSDGGLWVGRGQCLEHYGSGEAYLSVLEAFRRLCKEPEGQELMGCWRSGRRPGWCRCPGSSMGLSSRPCSGGCWEPSASACCERWQKPLKR
jgi:DNA-binding winged helix-turn-helix (wHTH) protein